MDYEPILGTIGIFAGNFPPKGWMFCEGQALQVTQNQALYTIIGTIYGGDGRTTFNLPDLRGAVPMHAGQSPQGTSRVLGKKTGEAEVALTVEEIPVHTHVANASTAIGNTNIPTNAIPANAGTDKQYASSPTPGNFMAPAYIQATGGGQAHNNMQPSLGLRFVIAVTGDYPMRP